MFIYSNNLYSPDILTINFVTPIYHTTRCHMPQHRNIKYDKKSGECSTHFWSRIFVKKIPSDGRWTDRKKKSKWILEEQGAKRWSRFSWLRIGTGGGSSGHGNVYSRFKEENIIYDLRCSWRCYSSTHHIFRDVHSLHLHDKLSTTARVPTHYNTRCYNPED